MEQETMLYSNILCKYSNTSLTRGWTHIELFFYYLILYIAMHILYVRRANIWNKNEMITLFGYVIISNNYIENT
jgi:surface polysaccharide O-acyltransferase-like enzyme